MTLDKSITTTPTRAECLVWLRKRTVQYGSDEELLLIPAGESHIKSRDILNEIIALLEDTHD